MTAKPPVLFIDIEASSLAPDSHPIEIAWVTEAGQDETHLIREEPDWCNWSRQSEATHGISRPTLMSDGRPATEVAHDFIAAARACRVASDAPAFDRAWLDRLLATIDQSAPQIVSIQQVWGEAIRHRLDPLAPRKEQAADAERRLSKAVREAGYHEPRHRALADARSLWLVWQHLTTM